MPIASCWLPFIYDFEAILQKQINYIRYADDLVVFANKREKLKTTFDLIRAELLKIQLHIPDIGVGNSKFIPNLKLDILRACFKKINNE